MEVINHEYNVSLEVAKLLREAGFDWDTFGYYNKLGFFHRAIPHHGEISAPTLEVVQRWLRKVKNTHIIVTYNPTLRGDYVYDVFVPCNKFWLGSPISYDTYEEAQEAGIKKALEILLEKGE